MTNIYMTGYGESEAVPAHGRRSTSFRSTVEAAVSNAVGMSGDKFGMGSVGSRGHADTGIVFVTRTGERWPEVWWKLKDEGKSVTPTQFPGIVHNAAPGQIAIRYSLTGPHLAIVDGDALALAMIQIRAGRAARMIVCGLESPHNAVSLVIQSRRREGQRSCILADITHFAPSTSNGFRRLAYHYKELSDHFERSSE